MRKSRPSNRPVDLYVTLRSTIDWAKWLDALAARQNKPRAFLLEEAIHQYSLAAGSPAGPPPERVPGRSPCVYAPGTAGHTPALAAAGVAE
jgi:hypothetical protein